MATVDVELEGTSTKALIDTGSPVTIVSLKFLVNALAKQRPPHQSPSNWRAEVEKRLLPPSVPLRKYGGGELNIVREIRVTLTRLTFSVEATVQVHAGAPVDLLLGTDVQLQLGLVLLAVQSDGKDKEPLQGKTWKCDSLPDTTTTINLPETTSEVVTTPPATVSLIHATTSYFQARTPG